MINSNYGVSPSASHPLLSKSKEDYRNLYRQYGFDPSGNNEYVPMIRRWQTYLYPTASQGLEFFAGLQPQRQSAIRQLLDSLSPSGLQAKAQGLQNQAAEQAAMAARQANLMNRSMGYGDGFSAGNTAAIMGQAARTQSDIARQYADPQFQAQALTQLLGVYDQAAMNPAMQLMASFQPEILNQNQFLAQNANKGFMSQISPIIGMAAGNPSLWNGN